MTREKQCRHQPKNKVQIGKKFENAVLSFFAQTKEKFKLRPTKEPFSIGMPGKQMKGHKFDLIDPVNSVLVECKSHTWTKSGNKPVAKLATWNEAMLIFCAVPPLPEYRKIFCVRHDYSTKHKKTLAAYYLENYAHLIPKDVEIWEVDQEKESGERLYP